MEHTARYISELLDRHKEITIKNIPTNYGSLIRISCGEGKIKLHILLQIDQVLDNQCSFYLRPNELQAAFRELANFYHKEPK